VSAEAPSHSSQRHVGKTAPRGAVPLREGESFEGPKPHERARHEIKPWRSWQKQSVGGAKEPRGRNGPGEANPVMVGCRDRKR